MKRVLFWERWINPGLLIIDARKQQFFKILLLILALILKASRLESILLSCQKSIKREKKNGILLDWKKNNGKEIQLCMSSIFVISKLDQNCIFKCSLSSLLIFSCITNIHNHLVYKKFLILIWYSFWPKNLWNKLQKSPLV